eukprot:TRINITY_DN42653_c0_g1_i1.p1 TRINITY_DN42653_c0_g1~~TRINITY_DN42653_c0_g1_i1.p1  ORF type:complete len:355 (+),score=59.32 TRINITY_DN42653_c0_g1_i1:118-1065(+)
MTVITTIGYGSLAPSTYNGRSFTVIYAILGIGVVAQLLGSCAGILLGIGKGIAQRLLHVTTVPTLSPSTPETFHDIWSAHIKDSEGPISCIPTLIEALVGMPVDGNSEVMRFVKAEASKAVEESTEEIPLGEDSIHVSEICRAVAMWFRMSAGLPRPVSYKYVAMIFSVSASWVFIWAFAFAGIEGWEYREGLWFCVITMSTIGFGDFTPELNLSRALAFVFIIPGLGLSAACLGAIWDVFELHRFWLLQKLVRAGNLSPKFLEAHDITTSLCPTPYRPKDPFLLLGRTGYAGSYSFTTHQQPLLSPTGEHLYRL